DRPSPPPPGSRRPSRRGRPPWPAPRPPRRRTPRPPPAPGEAAGASSVRTAAPVPAPPALACEPSGPPLSAILGHPSGGLRDQDAHLGQPGHVLRHAPQEPSDPRHAAVPHHDQVESLRDGEPDQLLPGLAQE